MFKSSKPFFQTLLIFFLLFFIQSCKTTNYLEKDFFKTDDNYIFARDISFPENPDEEESDNYKYIFFRLYNPEYKNPFYIANLLKGGLSITKTDDGPELSHSAINFSLKDNYYGLTFGGKHQLAEEACSFPKDNKYMKNCDPTKSEQITYALKVSQEEYDNTKKFVERYAESTDLKYASLLNVKIGIFFIKQRFFTPKKYQTFGSIKYPKSSKNKKINLDEDEPENKFVCSTFLGYVLYNNVDAVTKFFDEKNIKYEYLNVTDLSMIPGMVPLFYSNWDNYEDTAQAFVKEYPEFAEYLTN